MTRRLGSAGPVGQRAQAWPLRAARVPPRMASEKEQPKSEFQKTRTEATWLF